MSDSMPSAPEAELRWYGRQLSTELKQLKVIVISDVHFGNPTFSMKHFQRTLEMVKRTPDMYVILNGDLCEAMTIASKGNIYKQTVEPEMQRDNMIEFLLPIKDKILGMTTGNHEARIREIDISRDIARALNVPYRPEGILLKISFGDGNRRTESKPYVYWAYATHGYGGARTKSSKAIKVERLSTWIHADFYCMSHDHVVNVAPDVYLLPDNRGILDKSGFLTGKIVAHRKMLIKTGAYLKWGGYSEQGGFPPVDLETPIIKLAGEGRPQVRVEV